MGLWCMNSSSTSRHKMPQPGQIGKTVWYIDLKAEGLCFKMFLPPWKENLLMNCKHCISNLREFHFYLCFYCQFSYSYHFTTSVLGAVISIAVDRDADVEMGAFLSLVGRGSTLMISVCRLYSLIQKLTCLLLPTPAQAALSASASVLLSTVSGWFPGQHLMNQREAYP